MNNCDNYSDREFVELLLCALDGALNEEQFNSLQKQIVSNGDAQELYYDFLITYAGLSRFGKSHTSLSRPDPVSEYDDLLALMAEHERTAPAIEIPKEKPKREPVKMLKIEKVPRQVSKFSLYTLIISAAAMLLFVLWLQLAPVLSPIVATLTDSIDAEWGDTKDIVIGDVLRQEEMTLLSGLAEITFEKGAKVVLEAPVKIELNDINQMFLHEGKLAARVPPEAYGFTVDTPDASIKDIGTSFGVNVREGRASEVFVFKGKIKLVAKDEEKQAGAEQILTQGQAKTETANGREIKDIDNNKE